MKMMREYTLRCTQETGGEKNRMKVPRGDELLFPLADSE
jgi:hypothetical protein